MNNITIDILNEYHSDILSLDISNKEIEGILDLQRFVNLKALKC